MKASRTRPARSRARSGLGKLIVFYDDNGISIDGHVKGWFTDDTPKRFEAYGWHVVRMLMATIARPWIAPLLLPKAVHDRPSLTDCIDGLCKVPLRRRASHTIARRPLRNKDGRSCTALEATMGAIHGLAIVAINIRYYVPAICFEFRFRRVVGEPTFDMSVDGNTVVVVEHDELSQAELPRASRPRARRLPSGTRHPETR